MNIISKLWKKILIYKALSITGLISIIGVFGYIYTAPATKPIFIGLIPACIIGILWDLLIKNDFLEYVKREIKRLFDDAIENFKQKVCEKCKLVDPLNRFTIKDITTNRQRLEEGFDKYLKYAQHRVWILVTHFKSLTELAAEMQLLQEWSEKVEIKILGLNPRSDSAKARSKQPDQNGLINDIKTSGEKVIKAFKDEAEKKRKYVEIKLCNNYPTCCSFLVDSRIFFSPLVFHKRGKDSIHFVVHETDDEGKTSELFIQYKKHFETLFEAAEITVLKIENGDIAEPKPEIFKE